MSFRGLTMMAVKEVLRRWQVGQSARRMGREGVVSRRTAARYLEAAKKLGLSLDSDGGSMGVASGKTGSFCRRTSTRGFAPTRTTNR